MSFANVFFKCVDVWRDACSDFMYMLSTDKRAYDADNGVRTRWFADICKKWTVRDLNNKLRMDFFYWYSIKNDAGTPLRYSTDGDVVVGDVCCESCARYA